MHRFSDRVSNSLGLKGGYPRGQISHGGFSTLKLVMDCQLGLIDCDGHTCAWPHA